MKNLVFNENLRREQIMEDMPKDPFMLMSWVNMKLRDRYESLEELCDDLGVNRKALEAVLNEAGFEYMPEINQYR